MDFTIYKDFLIQFIAVSNKENILSIIENLIPQFKREDELEQYIIKNILHKLPKDKICYNAGIASQRVIDNIMNNGSNYELYNAFQALDMFNYFLITHFYDE